MRKRLDHFKELIVRNASSKRLRKLRMSSQLEPMDKAGILLDLIRSRRSIRFFEKAPIPDEHLMMILEAARWAPSAANAQPWDFLVIKDQRVKQDLMNTMKQVGKAVKEMYAEFPWGKTSRDPELVTKNAVVVAVCVDFNREELRKYDVFPLEYKKKIVSNSVAAGIISMMLMATALGIGSLWMTPMSTAEIKRSLCIPETLHIAALVALGYPARGHTEKTTRRPIETMVHYDKFNATQWHERARNTDKRF